MALSKYQQKQKKMRRQLREDEKLRREAAGLSINVLSVVPVYVLYELCGWKRIRLSRFIRRYSKIIADIASGKVSPEALAEQLMYETGIKYADGEWYDLKAKESVRK